MVYSFVCKKPFPVSYLRCQFNMLMNFFFASKTTFGALAGANIKPFFNSYNSISIYFKKTFLKPQNKYFMRTIANQ